MDIRAILEQTRSVAVLWANPRTSAPAFYVPAYLAGQGYRVYPIHPAKVHADKVLWGEPMRAGAVVGLWGRPLWWDEQAGTLRPLAYPVPIRPFILAHLIR
jgi:hypothetical protein